MSNYAAQVGQAVGQRPSVLVRPVPMALLGALALLVWVATSKLHIALAPHFAEIIGQSPLPALSARQLGKLLALLGFAAIALALVAFALALPHSRAEKRLAARCLVLLFLGGGMGVGLDLLAAFGVVDLWLLEQTIERLALIGVGLLLLRHVLREELLASVAWPMQAGTTSDVEAADGGTRRPESPLNRS